MSEAQYSEDTAAAADQRIMRHIAICGVVTFAVAIVIALTANFVA